MFKGSGVALITPFINDEVNYEKLEELLNWHIKLKTDAIIICGTTGEASTLTKEEKKQVISFTVKTVGNRIPVIAGTGSNNTKEAIEMSQYAQSVGVSGLLIVTPYYNKTTQLGLIKHFNAIADSVDIPIILYNVPGRTGLNITAETVFALSKHPNIKGVKEASGDISQVAKIAKLCGNDFFIYSGNDDQIIPVLSLGGCGVISVVANILPYETHSMVNLFLEGKIHEARNLQLKLLSLINSLFIETNPIPIKKAMNLLGMNVGLYRLPLVEMESKNITILKQHLLDYGLSLKEEN